MSPTAIFLPSDDLPGLDSLDKMNSALGSHGVGMGSNSKLSSFQKVPQSYQSSSPTMTDSLTYKNQPNSKETTSYLVIGSPSTASDHSYQSLIQSLRPTSSVSSAVPIVDLQMVDRILDGATTLPSSYYGQVYVRLRGGEADVAQLAKMIAPSLKVEDGKLEWQVVKRADEGEDEVKTVEESLKKGGFSEIQVDHDALKITAKSPISTSSSAPLSIKLKPRSSATAKSAKAALWSFTPAAAQTTTIDESTLLTDSDLARPTLIKREDCDVKKTRKACKNCTCGLRELELEVEDDLPASFKKTKTNNGEAAAATNGNGVKKVKSTAVTSSCGSCYLGDAFRCSSCPYLGLPAFNPGDKVEIPADMDDF